MNRMMVLKANSPAIHKLGDIRRKCDDYIRVFEETETQYIGNFEEGFGLINVKFNKSDCRPLTSEELTRINGSWYVSNNNPFYRISLDESGNVIKGNYTTKKGIITKITDNDGNEKHLEFKNFNIEFIEDIIVGKSMIFKTNEGSITTSAVTNVNTDDSQYIIYTKNSIYYIKLI